MTEKLLNHVLGALSAVVGVYNRYSYAVETRAAVETHEAHEAHETHALKWWVPPKSFPAIHGRQPTGHRDASKHKEVP